MEATLKNIQLNKTFHKLSHEFYIEFEKILSLGVIIKDVEQGLIDFYTLHEDREIFLCWKYGEDSIQYWHEILDGFPGRKHISKLSKIQ